MNLRSSVTWFASIVVLFIAGEASPQQPIQPIPMTPFADGANSLLNDDLKYQVGDTRYVILVPKGFVTDFASTPRAIWAVLPPAAQYQLAAIVHDFLYWDQGCTREQADALLRAAMAESKVDPIKRDIIWGAVRNFGQGPWANNAREKAEGQPRVIPSEYLSIPALMTWTEYRTQLFTEGVRPAPTPQSAPDYCDAAKFVTF